MIEKVLIGFFTLTLISCSERSVSELEVTEERETKELNYKKVDDGYVIYLDNGGMVLISDAKDNEFVSYEVGDRSFLSYSDGRYIVMNSSDDLEVMTNDDSDIEPDFIRKKDSIFEVNLKLNFSKKLPLNK